MTELSDHFAHQNLYENAGQTPASPANEPPNRPIDFQEVGEIENPQRGQILEVVDRLRHLGVNDVLSIPQVSVHFCTP